MKFDIVVAADQNWGIGKDGKLPWHCPSDLAWFRRLTVGGITAGDSATPTNAVIMGRLTYESIGKYLPRRLNIIVGTMAPNPDRTTKPMVPSLDEALRRAAMYQADRVYVIGGARLYAEALKHPELEYTYLTRIEGSYGCDRSIPDLDEMSTYDRAYGRARYGAMAPGTILAPSGELETVGDIFPACSIERRIMKR